MTTTRKTSCCGICENSNLASICPVRVNYRLNEYNCNLRFLKSRRDALFSKPTQGLVAKGKADDQHSWRVLQNEKFARLRYKLRLSREQVSQGKAKIEKMSHDLKVKCELLGSAMNLMEKNRAEQIEKYYPNLICTQSLGHMAITSERLHKQSVIIKQICKLFPQRRVFIDGERKDGYSGQYDTICNARLPRGLDPHSVPSDELAASLGFQNVRTLLLQSASESVKLQKLTDSDSGIWEVNLERPSTRNAIGRDMLRGLQYTLDSVNRDQTSKVLMICSSVPKAFCAGADLKERKKMSASEVQDFVHSLRSTFAHLEALCIPTIAVIEGAALGGGLEMALSCDLRICGEDALLGLPETGLAIIPGAGGTQRLPRLVGKSTAKELIFTGRKVDGRDALSMGLVNYCVPAGEARSKALEIAREINQKGPLAIRMAKRAIDGGMEVDMASGLALEDDCYEKLLHSKDRLEGLAAFAERRKPNYADAFTPGDELQGVDVDYLYTYVFSPNPAAHVSDPGAAAYMDWDNFSREGTLVRDARDMINPKIIQKLEEIKKSIQDHFM